MLASHYMPDDDVCPVGDELLGELYSASKLGLPVLVATVPPTIRALLALFCYHRHSRRTTPIGARSRSRAARCESWLPLMTSPTPKVFSGRDRPAVRHR
jgi:hypothetical protein